MNRFVSQKIRFFSFVCIALLLFVHGYNLEETYLQPFSLVKEQLTFTTYFEYFVANALLRFRIPLLFIISGYIFVMQEKYPYWQRIKKRFGTLIVPFFIWSAIGLAITFLWQQHPVTAHALQNAQLDQMGDNRPYSEIGWGGVLFRWALAPISFQLWFIRSLFIYNMLYPFFKWVVSKYPVIWFSVLFLLMLAMFQFIFIEAQGMFFFTLGIWLNQSKFPVDRKPAWYSNFISWLFFLGFGIIKTFMAFEFEEYGFATSFPMVFLHYIAILAGVIAVWYSSDPMVKWCMQRKWFVWTTAFAFVIYGLHVPLLPYVTNLVFLYCKELPYYRLVTFIVVPFLILLFCIGTGALLRRLLPRFYRVLTGGRGM